VSHGKTANPRLADDLKFGHCCDIARDAEVAAGGQRGTPPSQTDKGLARFGAFDRCHKRRMRHLLRTDTPARIQESLSADLGFCLTSTPPIVGR